MHGKSLWLHIPTVSHVMGKDAYVVVFCLSFFSRIGANFPSQCRDFILASPAPTSRINKWVLMSRPTARKYSFEWIVGFNLSSHKKLNVAFLATWTILRGRPESPDLNLDCKCSPHGASKDSLRLRLMRKALRRTVRFLTCFYLGALCSGRDHNRQWTAGFRPKFTRGLVTFNVRDI